MLSRNINPSLPKANLTKPRKHDIPNCPMKSRSVTTPMTFQWVLSNGGVHILAEQSFMVFFFANFMFNLNRENEGLKISFPRNENEINLKLAH